MTTPLPDFPDRQFTAEADDRYEELGAALGDRRDGRVYVYEPDVRAAVRVALASERPLLLRGPAGSGKSSLAPFVARLLKRRFYWATVTARTEARDLLWQFDALRRLNDAQSPLQADKDRVARLHNYVEPGVLWWAFDAASAKRRGLDLDNAETVGVEPAEDRGIGPTGNGVVVLIDEIDKADPDVPNNLLEALGSLQFRVHETGTVVRASAVPLVMITTNDERELPAAFLRRCAVLYLKDHTPTELLTIAMHHFGRTPAPAHPTEADKSALFAAVAARLVQLQEQAREEGQRVPSTAEYLDAVRACLALGIDPADPNGEWPHVVRLVLRKQKADRDASAAAARAEAP
jgi:MoxR-like ATPase